ncbi:RNA polymerase sigma factor [Sediminicola luteus]|uniref:HTH luxR-type domain-containing protein n=1 Tax=Sediminicola luteus TaxID=319238 RepID=A0A2A4GCU1_9FLAO|nr:sigma-70 family RNA polymerase sigma factor [Sediminicola luteus]PCE65786.1 hypothetical protein B7P33_00320 [Sediminicola luteus]
MGEAKKQEVRLRDRETFDQVFGSYYPILVFHAVKLLDGDRNQAEDMVQDVFVKILDLGKVFENEDRLGAYLYTMVRNQCLNHKKFKQVRQLYAEKEKASAKEAIPLWEVPAQEESYRYLRDALTKLPERCRQIFELTLRGYRIAEIAQEMGISEETVKSQKKRGKALLREHLGHLRTLTLVAWVLA